ncbi:MAG: DUF2339 domain-containing protein [Enterobacter sp.]|nr:DUF2339 domain-containing protein [Enterobacter sp.]
MDELYILGCFGFNRSTAAQQEIARLRQRIEALEQRGVPENASEPVQTAAPEAITAPVVEDAPAPVDPWRPDIPAAVAEPASSQAPTPAAKQPSAFGGILTSLARWFMQGNPLAKLGILLLFLGLSFLLRYTVEHSLFPLELRLVAAALFAVVLLAIGWRLRHRQRVYALILQGGATGVLYLTVFGAFRLWQMLPMTLAFALLVVICAASVGLAVLQKALSLAMLASLGGYLAPLLLSTGGGSFVALFSFYLLLSIGILAISIWQHWRELNLLGLLFTFGVGGLWGLNDYQPGKQIVDGVLLFAPPLIGFGMQYGMTRYWEYGPALSALGYGAFYLTLAYLALRRYPSLGRPLVMAALAIGGGFATLAIPLALSARWTAMAWALEGLGILWLGVQQHQRRMSYSGTALLVLALGSALWAQTDGVTSLSLLLIFAILSLCWLAAAWLWRTLFLPVSWALLAGGLLFWLVAQLGASQLILTKELPVLAGVLALTAASVWGWQQVAARLAWRELDASKWLLWPVMLLMVGYQIWHQQIVAAGWSNLAWCVALPTALMLLRRDGERVLPRIAMGLHLSLCWMILLALAAELYWFARSLPWGMAAWGSGLAMAAGGGVIMALSAAVRRRAWPFREWPALYACLAPIPAVVALLVLLVVTNFQDGVVYRQTWLPLVNPLEEGAAFALLGLVVFYRAVDRYYPALLAQARPWPAVALMAFGFWWLNGALMRALAWYGDVAWNMASLWDSRLIQTSFALFMIHATRRASRQEWLCGAALLGVVMVKLMLVDSAGGGGLSRAVAFIGVAILVLIVGYFSPLPPKTGDEK